MLINFTNHPSKDWTEKQMLDSIQHFDKIYDLPFPKIELDFKMQELTELVNKYADIICNLSARNASENFAVLIMGEQTFTYGVVNALQDKNITCVATISPRQVKQLENNKKLSEFDFYGYREYPTRR
jgi:hypothetical protein